MFPNTDHPPTNCPEDQVSLPISANVGGQLFMPPLAVCVWEGAMVGTAVPEAPVDEHGDLTARERDVGSAARHTWERPLDPVAEASSIKFSPEGNFRCRVTTCLMRHSLRCRRVHRRSFDHLSMISHPRRVRKTQQLDNRSDAGSSRIVSTTTTCPSRTGPRQPGALTVI